MVTLSVTEWINLVLGLMALLPAAILINQYRRTRIQDFLIFGGAFSLFFIMLMSAVIGSITKHLLLMQIHHWCYNILFFLLFLHAVRMRWERAPAVIWYVGVIWCSILVFLIVFWEIMPQPEKATVLFWEMPHGHSSYYPDGAGIITSNGVILYSTAHNILRLFYSLYTWTFLLYSYGTVQPIRSSKRIKLARRLMLLAIFLGYVYLILTLPWVPYFPLLNAFLIFGFIILAYVAIRLPEGLMLSHVQILRALTLYKQIQTLSAKQAVRKFGNPTLISYLQALPPELLRPTRETLE